MELILKKLNAKFYGVLPKGCCLLLYGSYARGDANEDSDIDLWLLHEDDSVKNAFSGELERVRHLVERCMGKSVALENDCWNHFKERLKFADPWSVVLAREAGAVIDPEKHWGHFKDQLRQESLPKLDCKESAVFYAQYAEQSLQNMVCSGNDFFARLYVYLVAKSAEGVVRQKCLKNSELEWSEIVKNMDQDYNKKQLNAMGLEPLYDLCRQWNQMQKTSGFKLEEFIKMLSQK